MNLSFEQSNEDQDSVNNPRYSSSNVRKIKTRNGNVTSVALCFPYSSADTNDQALMGNQKPRKSVKSRSLQRVNDVYYNIFLS